MATAKRLTMGTDSPTPDEEKERIAVLRATVETYLPNFAREVATTSAQAKDYKDSTMVFHQDAFAAGYHDDEYTLLGMAVKYAGLHGVVVTVVGTNQETF